MAKFQAITLRKEDNIAVITLNRPESLNAITSQMVEELHTALDNIEKDEEVRVLILTGALRAFCAGADLKPGVLVDRIVAASAEQQRREIFYGYAGVSRRLHSIEIPTVAMINGIALGAGMDWACACDFRVGSEKARFRVGFTQVATVAAAGGVWFLPRITGLPRALELTYSNRFVEAEEAERIGLLNKMIPSEALESETMALARVIAANPPIAIRLAKLLIREGLGTDLESSQQFAAAAQAICFASDDYKEAIAAFREKRQAHFRAK